jgi:hypothetical protein
MTFEAAIISNKRVSNQLGCIQKGLGILLALIILVPIGFCVLPFVIPEVLGSISVAQANYPEAQLIYSGYRNVGSSPWQLKSFVYWTNDSIDHVKAHYEKQVSMERYDVPVYKGSTINAFIGKSDKLVIVIANANQTHLGNLLDQYGDDPYSKIDKLPKTGTLLILTHNIYAP